MVEVFVLLELSWSLERLNWALYHIESRCYVNWMQLEGIVVDVVFDDYLGQKRGMSFVSGLAI